MKLHLRVLSHIAILIACCGSVFVPATAQVAPSISEVARYTGLHDAAHRGDVETSEKLIAAGSNVNERDRRGRTPLHVATFASHIEVVRALAAAGADMNALENDAYDALTIAAVANDIEMVDLVLALGNRATNVTSRYDGTALIAAAHLGHFEVVQKLIDGKAPLDHVNNLGWTALIEAVILGDGKENHVKTVRALVVAGADRSIVDRQGESPLQHAKQRGYIEMVKLLEQNN